VINLRSCVACGDSRLRKILDLGKQPLANEYLTNVIDRTHYPLGLNLCEACTHVQLTVAIEPNVLFKNYSYVSSTSKTLSNYFVVLKERIIAEFGEKGFILDVGSNDGSFLSKFQGTQWETLGVDPAANLASSAATLGVRTLSAFYDPNTAALLRGDFSLAVAMNVFAHTSSPIDILNALKINVSEKGFAFIQTSQANMFLNNEFDTVYHEHISFFNVRSMKALLTRAGWSLNDVSIVDVHGGSYLWKISRIPSDIPKVFSREEDENRLGMYSLDFYDSFESKCSKVVEETKALIQDSAQQGYKVAAFGAAAKGNTFFNSGGIIPDFIFDDTPLKIGKHSPIANVIVSDPNEMVVIKEKILFIIPAWNFSSEIKDRIRNLRGGSERDLVMTYFPKLQIEKI